MAAPPPPPTIAVLGSLNMDLVFRVPHHPAPGETLTSTSFATHCGGKGANQAAAIAKLTRRRPRAADRKPDDAQAAARVRMHGCVGQDAYGKQLIANLARFGVDTSGVTEQPAPVATGLANIIVDEPTGQNRIVLAPGANGWVGVHHVAAALGIGRSSSAAAAGGFDKPDLLVLQLEVRLGTVRSALEAARASGVPVLLNPAPARKELLLPRVVGEDRAEGAEHNFDALRGLAHLVVNETEAAILAGCGVGVLDTEKGCARVARGFLAQGVGVVAITLGGRGAYYMQAAAGGGGAGGSMAEVAAAGLVAAEEAKVVDTTGAGDTWVGQYAAEVVAAARRGVAFDVEAAVRKAGHAAAKAVQKHGAQDSIPWMDEL